MKVKVESPGKIFEVRSKQSSLKFDINVNKLNDGTYEVDIKDRIRVVTVRLQYELYQRMVDYAETNKVSISEIIRKALKEFLEREGF
jgi:preprotein translocase subunit SecB